jgi:hypothetical protein
MAKIRNIRTLESIAVGIRDLAVAKAPKDTGNLRSKIKSANTPVKSKMIKVSNDLKDISITLDYAPNGAEYGQWFNDPPAPASKRRRSLKKTAISRGNWNYAIDAINDDALNQKFDAFLDELGDYIVEDIEIQFDKI